MIIAGLQKGTKRVSTKEFANIAFSHLGHVKYSSRCTQHFPPLTHPLPQSMPLFDIRMNRTIITRTPQPYMSNRLHLPSGSCILSVKTTHDHARIVARALILKVVLTQLRILHGRRERVIICTHSTQIQVDLHFIFVTRREREVNGKRFSDFTYG